MRRALVLAVALAGCRDYGHAVALTVVVGDGVAVADIRKLVIAASGDEKPFEKSIDIKHQLDEGHGGFLYRPLLHEGRIGFAVSALDGNGTVIAFGAKEVELDPGHTVEASVTLDAGAPRDMTIEDGGGGDDGGSPCGSDVCTSAQLCCGVRCVAVDESNCFACGRACGGTTPVCNPLFRNCTPCSGTFCAMQHKDCDPGGACVACTPAPSPEPRSLFWVDAAATAPFTGSLGCPYKTIGEALTRAHATSSGQPISITIAKGIYASSESFPLTITRAMSIAGAASAGNDATMIVGEGRIDRSALGDGFPWPGDVSLLVDVAVGQVSLSRLQIFGLDTVSGGVNYGVVCDRGNAYTPSDAGAPATPSLTLTDVRVEGSFTIGVAAGVTESPGNSGCNLLMRRGGFRQVRTGIRASGLAKSGAVLRVGLAVGEDVVGGGNDFDLDPTMAPSVTSGTYTIGVRVENGVSPVKIHRNTFRAGDVGLEIFAGGGVVVDDNSFTGLRVMGMRVNNATVVDELNWNLFSGITRPAAAASSLCANRPFACGLWFDGASGGGQVLSARNNRFVDNDVGLLVTGANFTTGAPRAFDFGKLGDLGNNVFSCNSALDAQQGYDVWFDVAAGSNAAVKFAGNSWDRATPTTSPSPAPNGWDIVATSGVTVDALTPSLRTDACAAGRAR